MILVTITRRMSIEGSGEPGSQVTVEGLCGLPSGMTMGSKHWIKRPRPLSWLKGCELAMALKIYCADIWSSDLTPMYQVLIMLFVIKIAAVPLRPETSW